MQKNTATKATKATKPIRA